MTDQTKRRSISLKGSTYARIGAYCEEQGLPSMSGFVERLILERLGPAPEPAPEPKREPKLAVPETAPVAPVPASPDPAQRLKGTRTLPLQKGEPLKVEPAAPSPFSDLEYVPPNLRL